MVAAATTIEARLQVELERRYLTRPGPLPSVLARGIEEYPALLCRQRWSVVRASDLLALLQPWTEQPAHEAVRISKVAGVRYTLLVGLVDEPWVQVLVDEDDGRLAPWRGRTVARPLVTVVGRAHELERLALPRSAAAIEQMLRHATALDATVDWMLVSALGLDIHRLAIWLADLARDNGDAYIALLRRDVMRGSDLLADHRGWTDPSVRKRVRSLRNLYEIARLVELMRTMAGPGRTTADDLLVTLRDAGLTAQRLGRDDPGGRHLQDGWMHMSTLHAWRHYRGPALSPAFPLTAYAETHPAKPIGVGRALDHAETFTFYSGALLGEEIVAGTTRTLQRIGDEQPVDVYCGVELMRLAVVALRAIARKSGHRSALSHLNRCLLGRLSLILLRAVDRPAFDAYADHWAGTRAVHAVGLTTRDLDKGLSDPTLPHDIGSALVVKSEKVRRLVPVSAESAFDPFWWGRRPSEAHWRACHNAGAGEIAAQGDDEGFRRHTLLSVTRLGTDLPNYFAAEQRVVAEAVAICAEVAAHGTPLARDPKLFVFALRQAGAATSGTNPKLRIIPRSARIMASLGRRARHRVRVQKKNDS